MLADPVQHFGARVRIWKRNQLHAESIEVDCRNKFFMSGKKLTVVELEQAGLVNRIFSKEDFPQRVQDFVRE